jgi:hypothetical protein
MATTTCQLVKRANGHHPPPVTDMPVLKARLRLPSPQPPDSFVLSAVVTNQHASLLDKQDITARAS